MTVSAVSTSSQGEARHQFIAQLYEESVDRYGVDSEQAILLSQLIEAYRDLED
jgi:hypothetical protein